jgi:tetratricopeptide (TPR) repeat protein
MVITRAWVTAVLSFALMAIVSGQIDPKTALLERAGWEALANGQAHAAAEAFREAISTDPKNARLYLGAGTAAALEHRDADAKDAFETALGLDPRLLPARAQLGQVLYRLGDTAAAIRAYEILVGETPDDRNAQSTLDRWRRELELHDRMQQAIDAHFTVSFEGPEEATLARQALDSLDRAYWRVGQVLGAYPSRPLPVVLYTADQFRDITRSPAWAAGAYDGTIRVPMRGALDSPKELDRVMAHEFTHALIRSLASRGIPTWLDEGLATALEADDLSWAEKRVQHARALPLGDLQSGFGRLGGDQAQLAYATSALAVRRLLDEAGGFAIANLLRDLDAGVDFDSAFLHRMQLSFADFQAALF